MKDSSEKKSVRRNQKKTLLWLILLVSSLFVMVLACGLAKSDMTEKANAAVQTAQEPSETPTPELTEDAKPSETLAPKPTEDAKPSATLTPEPTEDAKPSETLTPEPTEDTKPSETLTPEPTEDVKPSATLTPAADENPAEADKTENEVAEWSVIPERVANGEIDPDAPMVALTFDDGPYTKVTTRILDALKEYDGRATFFVVGSRLSSYEDTLKRTYEEGHQIASHTWSHPDLSTLSKKKIQKELSRTEKKLNEYIPVGEVMLRPPYGSAKAVVKKAVTVPMITWSVDSLDWKTRDADAVIEQVLKDVRDGDIVLMHDLYESTAEAAERLIPELVRQGYQLVTVQELFAARGQELQGGVVYRRPVSE